MPPIRRTSISQLRTRRHRRWKHLCNGKDLLILSFMAATLELLALQIQPGSEDIAVGTVASHAFRGAEGILVLRNRLRGSLRVRELLREMRQTVADAHAHQAYTFARIVNDLGIEEPRNRNAMFDCAIVYEQAGNKDHLARLKNDLTVVVRCEVKAMSGTILYNPDLFTSETIQCFCHNFLNLTERMLEDANRRLDDVHIAPVVAAVIPSLEPDAQGDGIDLLPLPQRFEATVEKQPDAVALVFEEESITYQELNQRANQLAHYLLSRGVGLESRVGIFLERSMEMVVALLGVLKTGAAYVPLDPRYPGERLAFIREDAALAYLVDASTDWQAIAQCEADNPVVSIQTKNAAYIIYTSGSTGRPKGVLVSHGNIARLFTATQRHFHFSARDTWSLFHSYAFDFSVWELWGALLLGGKLVVVPYWVSRSPEAFYELLLQEEVTVLNQTPSSFRHLSGVAVERSEALNLRYVIFGGEALSFESLRPWLERFGDHLPTLVNMYGITETTVHVTYRRLKKQDLEKGGSLIGGPIADLQTYLVDEHGASVPFGAKGELYIGGAGLARGYWRRPELTAERFVPDAFSGEEGGRLYRSGDLGRYRADGTLEYLGRMDDQVKIRGYRIELGEIESVLSRHEQVREAAVTVREDSHGDKRLIGYVVTAGNQQPVRWPDQYLLPNGLRIAHLNRNETQTLYREVFEEEVYVRHGIELPDDAVVIDAGANIGLFTLFVLDRCRRARVYSFEPIPVTCEVLRANLEAYGGGAAKAYGCGLSRSNGAAEFTFYPRSSATSGMYADAQHEEEVSRSYLANQSEQLQAHAEELMAGRYQGEKQVCRLRTLAEVIAEEGLERIDVLKIDVEKSELDVLAGMGDSDWEKVGQIVLEVHDLEGRLEQMGQLLKGRGYEVTVEQDELLRGTELYNVYARRPGWRQGNGTGAEKSTQGLLASQRVDPAQLQQYLSTYLPEYMVPGQIVMLEALPLSPNGKVDRKALLGIEQAAVRSDPEERSLTDVEQKLMTIWREVLEVPSVRLDDDFFGLGGHSLLIVQLLSRIEKVFALKLSIRAVFDFPSLEGLANHIAQMKLAEGIQCAAD